MESWKQNNGVLETNFPRPHPAPSRPAPRTGRDTGPEVASARVRSLIWDTRTRRGKAELEKGKCNLRLERAEGGKGQVLNCPALGCLCSYGKHRHCLEEGDAAVSAIRGPARLATPHTASTQVLLETEDPVHALVLVPARGHC